MKLAILIASRNRADQLAALLSALENSVRVPHDVFVVEAGSDPTQVSPHANLWYRAGEFRGKAFGHCLALEHARLHGQYDYVWILSADLAFEAKLDSAAALIELLEREPRMAIAVPSVRSRPALEQDRGVFKPIATCESLGFVMRMSALDEVGFLNPQFQYGWGAMDELAHRLYRAGWFLARAQGVTCHYLPTSTQGHELSFDDYWRRARRFAFDYFRERHGEHWDELFWSATSAHAIEVNAFREHKRLWAGAFTPSELLERTGGDVAPAIEATAQRGERGRPTRVDARGLEAWPLATQAAQRLLAWPNYADASELEQLFDSFARPLVGRTDVCLCLRFDEALDGSEQSVVERLQQAFERTLSAQAPLEVLLIDDEIELDQLPRLGAAVAGFADLPSAAQGARHEFLVATGASALSGGDALRLRLEQSCAPRYGRELLDQVDFNLVNRIQELHPWPAECVLKNLLVRPGHGTANTPQSIQKLIERRKRAIVDPITQNFALEGARILELGAGFGLFSSHLVANGAAQVVLVESRERERRQAELYWSANQFIPRADWQLLDAKLSDPSTWERIAELGSFDVVLWTQALEPGVDIRAQLGLLARCAARLLVVDLSAAGGLSTSDSGEQEIVDELGRLGFELESKQWSPPGCSADEHALRSVLLAHKPKIVRVLPAALPQRADAPHGSPAVFGAHDQ